MRYTRQRIIPLLLILFIAALSFVQAEKQESRDEYVVENFKVNDLPHDNGTGLVLSWKPLDRSKRIISYRIYRGINPDTLFFLSSIDVNVKTGVASDTMYYYDSSWSDIIDPTSPKGLKAEKNQLPGSPLYQKMPRDLRLVASYSEKFTLLSIAENKHYHYRSKLAHSANPDDSTAYAGLQVYQQTIKGRMNAGEKYYYTVLAVDERGRLHNHTGVEYGVPMDNPPIKAEKFYGVKIGDQNKLQFEWDPPQASPDIRSFHIMMVPAVNDTIWRQVQKRGSLGEIPAMMLTQEAASQSYTAIDLNKLGELPLDEQSRFVIELRDAPKRFVRTEIDTETASKLRHGDTAVLSRIGDQAHEYEAYIQSINPISYIKGDQKLKEVDFFIKDKSNTALPGVELGITVQGKEYAGYLVQQPYSSFSNQISLREITSKELPDKPTFKVADKPNDKGDRLIVTWDEPIVFVNQTTSLNAENTHLRINYTINKSETQEINKIFFDFYKMGEEKPFVTINEFYQDDKFTLKVPEGYDFKKGFKVKIRTQTIPPRANGVKHEIEQVLGWDKDMFALMPTKAMYRNGVDLSPFLTNVYGMSIGGGFSNMKRSTAYDNSFEVPVSYVSSSYNLIQGFNFVEGDSLVTLVRGTRYVRKLEPKDARGAYTLLSSEVSLLVDLESEQQVSTNIFASEAIKAYEQGLRDLEADKQKTLGDAEAQAQADPEAAARLAETKAKITENYDKQIEAHKNKTLLMANKIKSHRGRMRFIADVSQKNDRSYAFKIIRTDNKGAFIESEQELNDKGINLYHYPVSNWFDRNRYVTLFASIIFCIMVYTFVNLAKRGKDLYIRPIAGLTEIENAVGRATEMGRPMLYCMGSGDPSTVSILASLGILSRVAKRAAEYDTRLIVPCYDYLVTPIAQEVVRDAHYSVGRPDTFDKNDVYFLTNAQFPYVAAVNGLQIRERMATNFFFGAFAAEALLMTETGAMIGAVQIAGSDAITQIPFFITTCDYTLIGEEFYAASAYLNPQPLILGTLKAQDYFKFLILFFMITGALLASFEATGLTRLFPLK